MNKFNDLKEYSFKGIKTKIDLLNNEIINVVNLLKKDKHNEKNRRNLLELMGTRRRLLNYIKVNYSEKYVDINDELNKLKKKKKTDLPSRDQSEALLKEYIENQALLRHSYMVATAMEAYAKLLGEDQDLWYQTGLLHDLDWEKYPR